MSKAIVKYFNMAKKLAKKSDHYQHKFGCVIVKKNTPVGFGYNQIKTHTKSPHAWKMIHAEFHAIVGVDPADLRNASVFVHRESKTGKTGMAKPCASCEKMLQDVKVKEVYYTTEDGYEHYELQV